MIDLTGKDQSWWPDLSGQTVAILAGGPSITREQCDVVRERGWYAIAINETWRLAQWAPALYGCDWQWWRSQRPLEGDYSGLRILGSLPNTNAKRPHLAGDMRWQAPLLRYIPVRAGYSKMLFAGRDLGAGSLPHPLCWNSDMAYDSAPGSPLPKYPFSTTITLPPARA